MCCEDQKIYSELRSEITVIPLTAASIELVGSDPYRTALVIGGVSAGTAWVIPDQPAVVGSGFPIAAGVAPLKLLKSEVGNLVNKAWFVIHTAGGVNICIAETIHPPGGVCADGGK